MTTKSNLKELRTRFIKDTIRNCQWEIIITEFLDGKIELWKQHTDDCCTIIKEVKETLTKAKADKYKEENKYYLVEVYEA